MNKVKIIVVVDKKLPTFAKVQTSPTIEIPKRELQYMINHDGDSSIKRYPEDYDVYSLGELDVETGEITPNKVLEFNCADLKTQ